jgi:hypothetical protein
MRKLCCLVLLLVVLENLAVCTESIHDGVQSRNADIPKERDIQDYCSLNTAVGIIFMLVPPNTNAEKMPLQR